MLQEAIPSFLAYFHAWFTPAVLFVLLNVVIGTIAVTSKASRREDQPIRAPVAVANDGICPKLTYSLSAVIYRVRSFNLHFHRPDDTHHDPTPPVLPSPASGTTEPDPAPNDLDPGEIECPRKSQPDAPSPVVQFDLKIPAWTKTSDSNKSIFERLDEAEILQDADIIAVGEEIGEVDARADDFINRFRQQLQLQRRDSLIRI